VTIELGGDRVPHARMTVARLRHSAGAGQVEIVVAVGVDHAHAARTGREERGEADANDAADGRALALEQRLAGGEMSLSEPRLEQLGHGRILPRGDRLPGWHQRVRCRNRRRRAGGGVVPQHPYSGGPLQRESQQPQYSGGPQTLKHAVQ
jgi:hypothetical protein